ncbi:MAG: VTT domain-containing protein [Bacteroidetes bacterium]|nr:VTT domain-containing protein [Bacteroidota bacterium]
MSNEGKYQFLFKNLLRGTLFLGAFVVAFLLFENYGGLNYIQWLEPIYTNSLLMYAIYSASELFFGIIPPEVFMAWGLNQGSALTYVSIVALLGVISYVAGWLNYWLGRGFRGIERFDHYFKKRLKKRQEQLNRYGGFLIIVAAVTPVPFAAVCLLMGLSRYSYRLFLLYTLFRLLRFAAYGYVVWSANTLSV